MSPPTAGFRRAREPACARWRADFRVFFDVAAVDEPIGRLVFKVEEGPFLEKTTENFKDLASGGRRILDPALTFRGCSFTYGQQYGCLTRSMLFRDACVALRLCDTSAVCCTVLQRSGANSGSYKWAHVCKGKGKNIFGKGPIKEAELMGCRHECPGYDRGSFYYGIDCSDPRDGETESDTTVQQHIMLDVLKPLGLVLEEGDGIAESGVFVADLVPGS